MSFLKNIFIRVYFTAFLLVWEKEWRCFLCWHIYLFIKLIKYIRMLRWAYSHSLWVQALCWPHGASSLWILFHMDSLSPSTSVPPPFTCTLSKSIKTFFKKMLSIQYRNPQRFTMIIFEIIYKSHLTASGTE